MANNPNAALNLRPAPQFSKDNQPANRGRKPGQRPYKNVVQDMLRAVTSRTNPASIDGEVIEGTYEEHMTAAQIKRALDGDTNAAIFLRDSSGNRPGMELAGEIRDYQRDYSLLPDKLRAERMELLTRLNEIDKHYDTHCIDRNAGIDEVEMVG